MPINLRNNRLSIAVTTALTLTALAVPVAGSSGLSSEVNAAAPKKCADLTGVQVAADANDLPTGGATVSSAVPANAGGSGEQAYGAHCLVSGDIRPVDPAAPNIKFQLALP
jgi:hypothetical protein